MELYPYQHQGVDFLAERKRAFLFDYMGLGKTPQAIRAADKIGAKMVGVICPASVVGQWQREIKRISATGFNFRVRSYDKVRSEGMPGEYDVLIIDEAHYLKNRKAARTKAILGERCDGKDGVISRSKYVWALTGSPMPNNPAELWSLLRALAPKAITMKTGRIMDYWSFVNFFCTVKNNGFGQQISGANKAKIPVLKERIAPHMLRRTPELVFPERQKPLLTALTLDAGEARRALKEIDTLLAGMPEGEKIKAALEKGDTDTLRSMASHVATLRRMTGLAKIAPLTMLLEDEVEGGLEKIVVFAYHTDVIEGLEHGLLERGIYSAKLTGASTATQRANAVKTFQSNSDTKVFLGQIQAAGTGLDGLQQVTGDMIIAEASWVPEENAQAVARLARIGQTRSVLARFASLEGSFDEAVTEANRRKAGDIVSLFG